MEIKSMAGAHRRIDQLQTEVEALTLRVEALERELLSSTHGETQDGAT